MNKFDKYKDILFSTISELTRLIIDGNDKGEIFQRLLECCLTVLEADRVYLLELDGNKIIKYSKSRDSAQEPGVTVEETTESSGLREWMIGLQKRLMMVCPLLCVLFDRSGCSIADIAGIVNPLHHFDGQPNLV